MSKLPEHTALHSPDPLPNANGSPPPSPSALPTPSNNRGPRALPGQGRGRAARRPLLLILLFLALLIGGDVAAHYLTGKSMVAGALIGPDTSNRPDVILHTV